MTKKAVKDLFREWRKENGNRKPNRVIVKMCWEDGDNTDKGYQVDTIGIVPKSRIDNTETIGDDCWILYYVSSLKGLLDLMQPDNGSDFIIDEVLEFYKK